MDELLARRGVRACRCGSSDGARLVYEEDARRDLVRELHARAMAVPSGADKSLSSRLAGFTREKVVDNHPSVLELHKELEAAAQKQAQAKQDTS